jgi:hypothetical protein
MTTAFSYAGRGRFLRAFGAQPAGLVLVAGVAAVGIASAWALVVGWWPAWVGAVARDYRTYAAVLAILLLGWIAKIVIGLVEGSLPVR